MVQRRWSVVEAVATGLATGSALVVFGALAVGSLRPAELAAPYWVRLGWLRTDTLGVVCFFMATLALATSETLRFARARTPRATAKSGGSVRRVHVLVLGAARALTAAGVVLVVYLSVNAVTHPSSLLLPATHLEPWPSESTLRVLACVVATVAAGIARTKKIAVTRGGRD